VINILFSILPNQQRARSDFCLISYVVNYGRVRKYIMRKSKRYVIAMAFEAKAPRGSPEPNLHRRRVKDVDIIASRREHKHDFEAGVTSIVVWEASEGGGSV
jgi:hypothetical protein